MEFFQRQFTCMTTGIEFKLWSGELTSKVNRTLEKAQEEFFRIANTYTRFNPNSELSELNRQGGREVKVTPEMFKLVEMMLEFASFSEGKFDPTVIDLLELHGYKSSFNPKQILRVQKQVVSLDKHLSKRASWRQIKLNRKLLTVTLAQGQRLDLGGIGKGYAIELAAKILAEVSNNYLISAGGDIYGQGINCGKQNPWQVALRLDRDRSLGFYPLNAAGEALASSGSWARSAGKFHHLLDPQTGAPSETSLQTFVSHRSPLIADALATVLFIGGKNYLDKIEKRYQAQGLLIEAGGEIYSTDNFHLL